MSDLRREPEPPCADWPLVVAYGLGVDSTAMLVGLRDRGIRPSAILFADTSGEKPETYAYREVIAPWLEREGFPPVETVRYQPVRAVYDTLEGQCLHTGTLPSLAYGGKSCSLKYKRAPQDKYILARWPEPVLYDGDRKVVRSIGYDAGEDRRRAKVAKAIGLDAGETHRVRWQTTPPAGGKWKCKEQRLDAQYFHYWYPLMDWGWRRADCVRVIAAAGLPVPVKSACWFCPASKKHEIEALEREHPDLAARALAIEANARNLQTVQGLGRSFSWTEYLRTPPAFRKAPKKTGDLFRLLDPEPEESDLVAGWG